MSALIKIEPNSIKGLSATQHEAIQAYFQPKIRALLEEDMVDPISIAIGLARLDKGQDGNKIDDEKTAEAVIRTLKKSFTTYTLQEIVAAIDMGAKGLLDTPKTFKVTTESIFTWVNAYNDRIRQGAYDIYRKHVTAQEKKESEEKAEANRAAFDKEIADLYRDFNFMEDLQVENVIPYAIKYRRLMTRIEEQKALEHFHIPYEKKFVIKRLATIWSNKITLGSEEGIPEPISLASIKNIAEAIALKKIFEMLRRAKKELSDNLDLI